MALLNVEEIAAELKVRPSQIYRMVELKKIPVVRTGRYLRFDLEKVIQYFSEEPIAAKRAS